MFLKLSSEQELAEKDRLLRGATNVRNHPNNVSVCASQHTKIHISAQLSVFYYILLSHNYFVLPLLDVLVVIICDGGIDTNILFTI